ncbi:MAG: hypothetical protein FWD23_16755, partial [Oscillospiraceae bacterium]|nr:hypothetical protein [Oscillospiraceae bacterium]
MILSQPTSVKLLMYYLIENKKRKKPDNLDIAASQLNYVPNLEAFKKEIVRSRSKLWTRALDMSIMWNKLGDALNLARGCGFLSSSGKLGEAAADLGQGTKETEYKTGKSETE